MKRKWLGLALAAVMACAGAATATEYTDSSANYPDGWATGSNGGSGFGAWSISSTGGSTYFGIWPVDQANLNQGIWADKGSAFAFVARGDDGAFTASRSFRAPLATGDSFSLEMGVNYDGDREGETKGFALTAKGATILTVNHEFNPGDISINGDRSIEVLNKYGTQPMVWTFTAKDATTLSITATPRDGSSDPYEADYEVPTSAIDGFRLQSAKQTTDDVKERQTYFDNFKLDIAGDLPDLVTLGLLSDDWAVTSASQTLYYTLTRSSSAGALDVTVSSSDESFVAGKTVSFADGEEAVKFELEATLTGSGNFATITASATGCDPATYDVKGPQYRLSVEKYEADPDETINFWMNWDDNGIALDEAKVTIEANPADSMELPTEWTWNMEEGGAYVASSFVALSSGTLILKYDGVQFADYGVTVVEAGATLSGPTSIRVGTTATYTADITLGSFEEGTFRLVADSGLVTIEPAEVVVTESGSVSFQVTAGDETGSVSLTLEDDDGIAGDVKPIKVTITEAPDYSKYIAYDDASLYTDGFDFASTGEGQEGFGAWSVYKDSAEFGGAIITDADGGFPAILSDGSAFAIYANGSNPDYAIVRPFVNDLQPGQEASIEFVVPEAGGSRYIQFARIWEGTPYNRFEIWANSGAVGINVDSGDSQELGWSMNARRVVARVKRAADGSDYTLSLSGYNEGSEFPDDVFQYAIDADVGSWGDGLQGIVIGGYDLGSDFIFNKLAIEQVEEPVKVRAIGWAAGVWNPDAAGEYNFAISATTEDIGEVALSVTPAEGALSLSTDTVDLTGVKEASFTVSLSEAVEGDSFVITATPADTSVAPIEYNVTVSATYVTLSSDAWEYPVSAGEIWLGLSASVSKYGTYAITSSDEAVLAVPEASEAIAVGSPDPSWFNVTIVGPGQATIYATAEGEETPAAEYTFTVIADAPSIDGTTIEVSFADGDGLSGKVDDTLRDQFTNVKAQVLQWNGVDAFTEVEVLENEAEWPDMQFTPSIDNPVIRLIFLKPVEE